MRDRTILIIIIIVLALYFLYSKDMTNNQKYTIPSEYKGIEGLNYIKEHYASELAQAGSLCINQFKGNWMDTSNTIGCYNMEGFSSYYCDTGVVKNLINLCKSIEGNSVCSSTQASCTV